MALRSSHVRTDTDEMPCEGAASLVEAGPSPSSLAELQLAMARLAQEAARADLRNFETLNADRPWQRIVARASVPIVCRIAREARVLADAVLDLTAPMSSRSGVTGASLPPPFLSFELALDAAVGDAKRPAPASAQPVADIAFLVQIELRQCEDRLVRVSEASDVVAILSECDSALRRTRKGLGALDAAIAAAEKAPALIEFSSELESSLRVRRAYARARRHFAAADALAPGAVEDRLRVALFRIEGLVGTDLSRLLRVSDRLRLLDVQLRVRDWLSSATRDDAAGARLWQDIAAFFEMLAQVNRRQELVAHDAAAVAELVHGGGTGVATDEGRRAALLASLEGLDDELDDLLAAPGAEAALGPVLSRLALRFGVGARRFA